MERTRGLWGSIYFLKEALTTFLVKILNNRIGRFNDSNRPLLTILGFCFDRIESGYRGTAQGAKTVAAPKARRDNLRIIHSEYGIY